MANWTTLKNAIANVIKTNGNQEITGQALQNVLNGIISSVGENATFVGVATPTTNPGSYDGPVFYLASEPGAYSNFGGAVVGNGKIVVLKYNNGAWLDYEVADFATPKISFEDLDFSASDVMQLILSNKPTKYDVMYNNRCRGIVEMFSDTGGHMLTQIYTTHDVINDSGIVTSHTDDAIRTYWRSYHLQGGTSTVPVNTWSKWKEIIDSESINNLRSNKVDKVSGKELSTNDYTNTDKTKLTALPTATELNTKFGNKLDKELWDEEHSQFGLTGYWHVTGFIWNTEGYHRTNLIPINHNYDIIVKTFGSNITSAIILFDANGKFISAVHNEAINNQVSIITINAADIPANAVYFASCTADTRLSKSSYSNGPTQESREVAMSEATLSSSLATLIAEATAAGAIYNNQTGFFELNGLMDLTATDMRNILQWGSYNKQRLIAHNDASSFISLFPRVRTTLPEIPRSTDKIEYPRFVWNLGFEVIRFSKYNSYTNVVFTLGRNCFFYNGSTYLREILDYIELTSDGIISDSKYPCVNFTTIYLYHLKYNVSLPGAPALSLESIQFAINNAINTSPITITLHPDAYARVTDEIFTLAAEKNITIATTE